MCSRIERNRCCYSLEFLNTVRYVVFLRNGNMSYKIERSPPEYEHPPPWKPAEERWKDPRYNSSLTQFLPRTIVLQKQIAGQALGFNIRGGKANECGVYISKVGQSCVNII